MIVQSDNASETKRYFSVSKGEVNMINTGEFKMFGQLEDQAEAGDIEAFVFHNGEVIPASQAENSTGPVIHTAPEKNYVLPWYRDEYVTYVKRYNKILTE